MIQRINFIEVAPVQFTYEQILKAAIILPLICMFAVAIQIIIGQRLDKQLLALTQEVEILKAKKASLMETSKPEMAEGPVLEIKKVFDNTPDWGKFFDDLSQRTPQNVWLLSIKVGGDKGGQKINLTGIARDASDVAAFLSRLGDSPFLKMVLLSQSKKDKISKDQLGGQSSDSELEKGFSFAIESQIVIPKE